MNKKMLIEHLEKDQGIVSAILFGSQATGKADSESDIDIALLYKPTAIPNGLDLLQFKQELSDMMHQEVDIVLLNNASPIIAMQAVKNGIPLFIRDPKAQGNYEVALITDYADLKKLREPFEKEILKRKIA